MIDALYQLVNKGSWRALSLILAVGLTICFFFNLQDFSIQLRSAPISIVLLMMWGTAVLWIHGIGFDIRHLFWKILFFPFIGYAASLVGLTYLF